MDAAADVETRPSGSPPSSQPFWDDADDFVAGLCTPQAGDQGGVEGSSNNVTWNADPVAACDDHENSDDDDDDGSSASFQLFDVGEPWTQAAPSTQFQRNQWLKGFRAAVTSSDVFEEDAACDAHRDKRRRVSSAAVVIDSEDENGGGAGPASICSDSRPSLASPRTPSARRYVSNGGSRVGTDSPNTSESDAATMANESAPLQPDPSTTAAALTAEDEEALQGILQDLDADDDEEDGFEILNTPPPTRSRLARMLSDLPAEKKQGYWSQFDDYIPPHETRRGDGLPRTAPATRVSSFVEQRSEPTTSCPAAGGVDSRLLPNAFSGFSRPIISASQLDEASSNANGSGHDDVSAAAPTPQRPSAPPRASLTALRGTTHASPIERMDEHSPGTLIARSRNATGMGMAKKTWESTWKARGVRVVKGRVVDSGRDFLEEPVRGRGRGRGGRGRGGARARRGSRGAGRAAAASTS